MTERSAAQRFRAQRARTTALTAGLVVALSGCALLQDPAEPQLTERPPPKGLQSSAEFPVIQLPPGYRIEKVVDKLTYPTSITWDDQGRMYVAEAGGGFLPEPPPARILRVDNGRASEVINLSGQGIVPSVVGLTWHDGAFYFTHRAPDFTGAVSRVRMNGRVEPLISGIVDSKSDHQPNDIQVGPDGRMYIAVGLAGNSGVMDAAIAPFVIRHPDVHATVCQDVVLTGQNFETPNFLTEDQSDTVRTGAFVPFGTETRPGQVIEGRTKCGGSILAFEPNNAEATLDVYAWGFRNLVGLAWNRSSGEMYAVENGYDAAAGRPVADQFDATYRVREGAWYGKPDFSAALEPLTNPKFWAPGELYAPVYVDGVKQRPGLGFVIDHEASGLTPPDRSLVFGLHDVNSSPSLADVAPAGWGDMEGQLFVAEWGDLAWVTNALRVLPTGSRIVHINPETGAVQPFVQNAMPGPASEQDARGQGLEHPFDVKFGPDGAMYIVDYGAARVNLARIRGDHFPAEFPPETGAIWRVTRTAQ